MYDTETLLKKINAVRAGTTGTIQLSSLMSRSFREVWPVYEDILTWGEANYLFRQAKEAQKKNKEEEIRILSRANPQLARAVQMGIRQAATQRDYDTQFGNRANTYVRPENVASMFSPAGYLTELYREAQDLHATDNENHLDQRRPDLGRLALSQENMDTEVTTLSIANDILVSRLSTTEGISEDALMEKLSTWRLTGTTPYHAPYEAARQAVLLQDPLLDALNMNPAIAALVDLPSLLAIISDISPELYSILTENITDENAAELYKKNFGDLESTLLMNQYRLASYYDLQAKDIESLVGLITNRSDDYTQPIRYYINDKLTTFEPAEDGSIGEITTISSITKNGGANFNYAELLPLGGDNYLLNINFKFTKPGGTFEIGTGGLNSSDLYSADDNFLPNEHVSVHITLPKDKLLNGLTLDMTQKGGGEFLPCAVEFTLSTFSPDMYLLYLNKILRLYKASQLVAEQVYLLIYNKPTGFLFDENVINLSFNSQYYMRRYDLSMEDAIILSGGYISTVHIQGRSSYFDSLFNTPLLNNREFFLDNYEVDWYSEDPEAIYHASVIKRGLKVNRSDLTVLWTLAAGENVTFTSSAENLALLYRVHLLAEVHQLTTTELALLLSVSPWKEIPLSSLSANDFNTLVNFVYGTLRWLKSLGWSVSDLYLMLTTRYSTVMTTQIQNLITSLRSAISAEDAASDTLITTLAPFIAAANQLDSTGKAESILTWLNTLKPGGTDVKTFIGLVLKDNLSAAETTQLVSFCQVLGQLTLLARKTGGSEYLLSLLVSRPELYAGDASGAVPLDINSLMLLTRIYQRIVRTGSYAQQLLAALDAGTLDVALLAQALPEDSTVVQQALTLADSGAGDKISSFTTLDLTLQWLDFSAALNTAPIAANALLTLKYTNQAGGTMPAYADWLAVSNQLQAGLSQEQTQALKKQLDESASAALSGYFIQTANKPNINDREGLYGWLLIDGLVSSSVTTTRLAEAIASIQLYVNRCRNALETAVDKVVLSRQFFTDWDTYNKRYSSWAGVSRLVYYPENYIDPTVRTGQTSMMDEMLRNIGQSELSDDTVGDAFKTYMTRFEKIANLDVISAYHDNISEGEGKTWFIGKSTAEGEKYYWRSLQQSMLSDGKYPATAWSEWLEVGTAIAAYNNFVRPVIFNDRLYLVWISTQATAVENDGTTTQATDYFISYSYIRHDSTWSTPVAEKLSGFLAQSDIDSLSGKRIYCTNQANANQTNADLVILFYTPGTSESQNQKAQLSGLTLSSEHVLAPVTTPDYYRDVIWRQLDLVDQTRVAFLFIQSSYGIEKTSASTYWPESHLSQITVYDARASDLAQSADLQSISLTFDVDLGYEFKAQNSGDFSNNTAIIMQLIDELGGYGKDYYIFPGGGSAITIDANAPKFVLVISASDKMLYVKSNRAASNVRIGIMGGNQGYVNLTAISGHSNLFGASIASVDDYIHPEGIFLESNEIVNSIFLEPVKFSFSVPPENVTITIQTNSDSPSASFNGRDDIEADSRPAPGLNATYHFEELPFTVPVSAFHDNIAEVKLNFRINSSSDQVGLADTIFTIHQTNPDKRVMTIVRTDAGAQYFQHGGYRTRVNTLFARQLVARANLGLNAVLSMDTQLLPEPKPGPGSYVTVTFDRYTEATFGEGWYELYMVGTENPDDSGRSKYIVGSGYISAETNTTVNFFLPYKADKSNEKNSAYIGVKYSNYEVTDTYVGMQNLSWDNTTQEFKTNNNGGARKGFSAIVTNSTTEPMDFSGANALYFWEMFFYVPSMVFQRLLQESKFDEATTWMKYIWDPAGYYTDYGEAATWTWNVRPLEEDTSWNPNPLDSVDPDAVAQSDPMHYKVATFMRVLDLLIARGDAAYRLLERDTLNEAKMWYVQALNLLGNEPYDQLAQGGWSSPVLSDAASQTLEETFQQQLSSVRTRNVPDETRTANSLVALFYPEFNDKLSGYWQTLHQRLYNLRHGLSIDGQPLLLPVYATAANPKALLSAAVAAAGGSDSLPTVSLPLYRFPVLLDGAKTLVNQLTQFGSTLLSVVERQDTESMSALLQNQGLELFRQSIQMQENAITEIDAEKNALQASREGAQKRRDSYSKLYDENVNAGEKQAMDLQFKAGTTGAVGSGLFMGGAALDMVPNIYGLADGGSQYGALLNAAGLGTQIDADMTRISADKIAQSEVYRRRRQEWEIQRNIAQSEITQIDAQLASSDIRREAAVLQKTQVETQLAQTQAQLEFLQSKFSNGDLYSWLRGTLSAIYRQFYDVAIARSLMAQRAWQLYFLDDATTFIQPGAWQGSWLGLMSGETLLLGLARMEQAWLEKDSRRLEVNKTVSLADYYNGASSGAFSLADKVSGLVSSGSGSAGSAGNTLSVTSGQLQASVKLSDLGILTDYPAAVGTTRRIKQISITLPALIAPYQDIRAVLSYGGSVVLPTGCTAIAISHGMNDSGQFQLDFNDSRWLPFEGIPVNDTGSLTLSFPDFDGGQKDMLLSLTDIILHIRYTIGS